MERACPRSESTNVSWSSGLPCPSAEGGTRVAEEVVELVPQERVPQGSAEHAREPQFLKETVEVKSVPQERVQQRAPVPQVLEEIVEVVLETTERVRRKRVYAPMRNVVAPMPQMLQETGETVTVVPHEKVQQRTVEHVPVPQILKRDNRDGQGCPA